MTATWNDNPTQPQAPGAGQGTWPDTWHHRPPASPPLTDADVCTEWGDSSHSSHAPHGAPTSPPPSPPTTPPPTGRRGGGGRATLAGLAAGTVLAGAVFAAGWFTHDLADDGTATAPAAVSAVAGTDEQAPAPVIVPGEEPVADVAAALAPSVVQIQLQNGLGSGVVYDASGLILTNAHVVEGNRTVAVRLADGTTLEGTVLGADTASDIAVVRVDGSAADLQPAQLAGEDPRVGDLAVSVGSPFGLDQTVTSGIVSAVDRPVDNPQGVVVSMLQTDASINPGNSGGALANRNAEVIGINTLIFSQSGENNGIGFATPIDKAAEVADQLVAGQEPERAFLGVSGTQQSTSGPGAELGSVEPGSPAEDAGLREGDVVTAIDGQAIRDFAELAAQVGERTPGDQLTVTVERGSDTLDITITVGTRTDG